MPTPAHATDPAPIGSPVLQMIRSRDALLVKPDHIGGGVGFTAGAEDQNREPGIRKSEKDMGVVSL